MTERRRVVLIGTRSTIGRAITAAYRSLGSPIVGIDIVEDDNDRLSHVICADMSDPAAALAAIAEADAHLGGVDTLITAAAFQARAKMHLTTPEHWQAVFGGAVDTTVNALRETLPRLGTGGSVVVISSVNAVLAHPGLPAYAAAKGALNALVRQVALDYGNRGIRINSVAPALVDGNHDPLRQRGYPLGRTVTSDEVAAAVTFLASDAASGITGVSLPVDAGLSVVSPTVFLRPDLLDRLEADG
ncbi:SDR family oxidoreductase [Ruania suaedae]|uniref:SDR family NAD(P)-dependent oxidoreductase n=1 Tax=Ruania suaedae TaxID=2897774 RepID=UPI001E3137EE|nr:SDR family oxidoreductase [Ruania suaedae]UFU02862.1 SDR family oxidoreductase [Ruania suaedae]